MYKRAYYRLFNAITDALQLIDDKELLAAEKVLRDAQKLSEEIIISGPEDKPGDNIVDFKKNED